MADWKEHVKDCQEQLGNGWDVVHHWLDEFSGIYWPWKGHRVHRHHREGIEECRAKWGDEAAYAAEIHILKDEGKIRSKEEIYKKYGVEMDKENKNEH
jgi:DNA-binding GntR family transcriptional regulator